jgi:hypothetical protein
MGFHRGLTARWKAQNGLTPQWQRKVGKPVYVKPYQTGKCALGYCSGAVRVLLQQEAARNGKGGEAYEAFLDKLLKCDSPACTCSCHRPSASAAQTAARALQTGSAYRPPPHFWVGFGLVLCFLWWLI